MPRTAGHRGAGCAWIRRSLSAISSHLLLCSYNRKLMVTDPETHEVYAPQLPGAPGDERCCRAPSLMWWSRSIACACVGIFFP